MIAYRVKVNIKYSAGMGKREKKRITLVVIAPDITHVEQAVRGYVRDREDFFDGIHSIRYLSDNVLDVHGEVVG